MLEDLYLFDNIQLEKQEKYTTDGNIYLCGILSEKKPACINCNQSAVQHVHKYVERTYQDLNIGEKKVWLQLKVCCYRCSFCNSRYRARSKDLSRSHKLTLRMEDYIGKLAITETYATINLLTGVSKGNIKNIFMDYIKRQMKTYDSNRYPRIIVGEVMLKKSFCVWIAVMQPCRIIYMDPEGNPEKIQKILLEWYGENAPEVIY